MPGHRPGSARPAITVALALIGLLIPARLAQPAEPSGDATIAPAQSHVLILTGSPGTPLYARHHADWAGRFAACFGSAGAKVSSMSGPASTATGIRQKIAEIASQVRPNDQFVLVMLGHGGTEGAFVVPGPDLGMKELAESLATIKAQSMVILNFTSSSGAALKDLRQPGRIVVTATSPMETGDSDFAEFFLQALESAKGRPISVLDTFNQSSYEHAQWITRQRQTEEGWAVEGRKSLEIFKKLYGGQDVPVSRRLAASESDGIKDDPTLPLVPDGKVDFWKGRRLVSEHALLEDTGQSEGAAAVDADGHHPLDPKKDDDAGALAKRVVLPRSAPKAGGAK